MTVELRNWQTSVKYLMVVFVLLSTLLRTAFFICIVNHFSDFSFLFSFNLDVNETSRVGLMQIDKDASSDYISRVVEGFVGLDIDAPMIRR